MEFSEDMKTKNNLRLKVLNETEIETKLVSINSVSTFKRFKMLNYDDISVVKFNFEETLYSAENITNEIE